MSEIAQGALIGLGGAVLGAMITGIISYMIARQQINARRGELKEQLAHQEKEARINRLIEARKDDLSQLRKTISEYVECSNQNVNMNVRLDEALKSGDTNREQLNISEYYETMERGKKLTSQLNIFRGLLSDNILDDIIKSLLDKQYEIDIARMPIVRFFNNPASVDSSTIESAMQKQESLFAAQRKKLIEINKRIEELLSVEPSK